MAIATDFLQAQSFLAQMMAQPESSSSSCKSLQLQAG